MYRKVLLIGEKSGVRDEVERDLRRPSSGVFLAVAATEAEAMKALEGPDIECVVIASGNGGFSRATNLAHSPAKAIPVVRIVQSNVDTSEGCFSLVHEQGSTDATARAVEDAVRRAITAKETYRRSHHR